MNDSLKINFVGDLCLQDLDADTFTIDEGVRAVFECVDISVANLEAPLTRSDNQTPDQPWNLKGKPKPSPPFGMFDIFSLANNHILDYGQEGLEETLAFLSSQGKCWFGAGVNEAQAWKPLCIDHKGFKVAFLGCTRSYNASSRQGGTTPMNIRRLTPTIQQLKKRGFFVVVCPHWNYEYVDYPSPAGRKAGRKLIDAGADLVVGGHPHHVQGFEIYQEKHMFHSLGNFIFLLFDLTRPEFSQTFILTVTINRNKTYSVETTPVFSTAKGLRLMTQGAAYEFHEKLRNLSKALEDDAHCKRLFYQNADRIISANMKALEASSKHKSGYLALLKRLHRIQKQDIYIKLNSLFSRYSSRLDSEGE